MIYIEVIKLNFFTVTYSVKINYTGYTFTITILKFSFFSETRKIFFDTSTHSGVTANETYQEKVENL